MKELYIIYCISFNPSVAKEMAYVYLVFLNKFNIKESFMASKLKIIKDFLSIKP